VAGVAALMKSANRDLSPAWFDQLLAADSLTDDVGIAGRDDVFGYGLIDARKAVAAALSAAGTPPPDNPVLASTPLSLNFGSDATVIDVKLGNAGTGSIQVTGVSSNTTWLQVNPASVTDAGIGRYEATVNRGSLADGVYAATIFVTSNVNAIQIPVIMSVGSGAVGGDTGHVYIVLLDPGTGETVFGTESDFDVSNFPYVIDSVPAGTYRVVAGTDYDNDGFICDDGEACGEYLTRAQPVLVTVDRDLTALDFLVNYESPVGPLATPGADPDDTREGIRRTAVKFVE